MCCSWSLTVYEPERTLKNLVALAHGELRFHPVRSTVEGGRLLRKVGHSQRYFCKLITHEL